MAIKTYVGDSSGVCRRVAKIYSGDSNNFAKKIAKAYIGDGDNLARLVFLSHIHDYLISYREYDDREHYIIKTCSCGDSSEELEEHNLTGGIVPPTCTEDGYTEDECRDCDYYNKYNYVDATGHDWEEAYREEATCTDDGYVDYNCSNGCGETKTEIIDALGHDEETVEAREPTCTENGSTEGILCIRCLEYIVTPEYIEPLGHEYTSVTTLPTCGVDGYVTYTCTRCDDSYIEEGTPATGEHIYLTESGNESKYCLVCGRENPNMSVIST